MEALLFIGLDSDRIHFLLVEYPHEIELCFPCDDRKAFQSWSWGLEAAQLSLRDVYGKPSILGLPIAFTMFLLHVG